MSKAVEFLKECGTFYLATTEGNQPRVRPFGAIAEIKGKVYTATNNTKPVFKQIAANSKVEISGCNQEGKWIRISADAVVDPDRDAKAEMLKQNPMLSNLYNLDDGIFEILYFENGTATISSFTGEPETFNL